MVSVDIHPQTRRILRCCIRLEGRNLLFLLVLFHFLVLVLGPDLCPVLGPVLGPVLVPVVGSTGSISAAVIAVGSSCIVVAVVVAFVRVEDRATLEGAAAADSMGSLSAALFAVPVAWC